MNRNSLVVALRSTSAAFALATVAYGAPVLAQDASAPAEEEAAEASDIVVTGSRLGRTGYDAPTPVNVVGQERLSNLGLTNVAEALNQIPSFRAIASPALNFFRVNGNIGGRNMDLRGLGVTRTLTLVDGRRFVPSGDNGAVDLNAIPNILVARSEVVTGGASAAYGANAVAGVVNLILDNKLSGWKAKVNYGISERGDGKNFYGAIAGGFDVGDRGHIVIGAEYSNESGLGPCETRDFCAKYTNYISNPGYNTTTRTSTNGLPATLVLDNVQFAYTEDTVLSGARKPNGTGGTIQLGQQVLNTGATSLPSVLRNKQFDVNGNLVPYSFGNYLSGLFMQGGNTQNPYLLGLGLMPLVVPTKHFSGMVHGDYEVSDSITASAEFMYAHVVGGATQGAAPLEGGLAMNINNPYISDATRATVLGADPTITHLLVNSSFWGIGPTNIATTTIDTYRGALGLKGDLGGGWNWDAYYTYGKSDAYLLNRKVRKTEWNAALDAVQVTAANVGTSGLALGSIVCRTTLTAPTNGCLPINPFLFGLTPQTYDRYITNQWQTRKFQQHALAFNLRGTPFSTWAGDVKVAVGGEWRSDTASGTADALTLAGQIINTQATALPYTKSEVVEGYVEVGVPLMKDGVLGDLDVDGALRQTHYNRSGDATTWKGGVVWSPIPDVTFRVTRSRDIREPTAQESSPNATTTLLPLPDPFVGGTTNQFIVTGGNPNLKLEQGDTFTAGVVLKPSFIPRFNLSLDYYNIKVTGAIDSLSGSAIATACKQQNLLCNLITFNSNGSINTISSQFQNLSKLYAEGLELVMDYRIPVGAGNIDLQANANYVIDLSTVGATGLVTQVDDWTGNNGSVTNIQGVPRYKLDGIVTYSQEAWSVSAHGRYIPRGILDTTKIGPDQPGYDINSPISQSINHVDARFYLDLTARIKIMDGKFEIFGNVNNVFDTQEPPQLRLIGNPLHFDPIGRAYKIGVTAKF